VGLVYLSATFPGRVHESRIWKEEKIGSILEKGFSVAGVQYYETAFYDRGGEGIKPVLTLFSVVQDSTMSSVLSKGDRKIR